MKSELNPIDECLSWFDVDGRKIKYEFIDKDIPVLRDAIRKHYKMEAQRILWAFVNKYAFAPDIKEQMIDELMGEIVKI